MKSQLTQGWEFHQASLKFLIIVLLVLGVFFRFVNLDRKVYWVDETYTSLRISGYRQGEVVQQIFDGHEVSIEDLQKYQRTNFEKNIIDTIKSLASDDPQHPPLYYVMVRLWVEWFGNSVAVTRSLSAVISLFAFPSIYWLCRELFKSSLVGWVAIALIAVSPLHILYAQQAREYSLWMVTILLSSAALLQAMRLKTQLSWGIYATTLTLGFYTYPFSVLLTIGHTIYVITVERFRLSKTFVAYLLTSIFGIIAFVPWLLVIITNLTAIHNGTAWLEGKVSRLFLSKMWGVNLSRIFWDVPVNYDAPFERQLGYDNFWTYLLLILVILIGYSLYFLCRTTPKQVWLFLVLLIGVTSLALMLPDLISGGQRSSVNRYLIPSYLGIQIAISYLFATKINAISFNTWQYRLWQFAMIILISSGIFSNWFISQAETWWDRSTNYYDAQVAHIINQAERPLFVTDTSPMFVFSLMHRLEPKVKFKLNYQVSNISEISDSFSDIFLYGATPYAEKMLRYRLKKYPNYKTLLVFKKNLDLGFKIRPIRLWKLVKMNN